MGEPEMKTYERPIVLVNEELAEGVYAASGADCFTVTAVITQKPETGRETYCIQVNARHNASDNHHSANQVLTLAFNQPVTYSSSNGTLAGGDGTASLSIAYKYHQNGGDNIGLGDVYVKSADGLAVTGAVLTCDHKCDYNHSW